MSGLMVTLLLFPLVGLALSRLSGGMQPFAAGCGVVGSVLYAAALAGVPLQPVVAMLVISSIAILVWRRETPPAARMQLPSVPTVLSALAVVWLSWIVWVMPLHDFDGRAFWLLKAKAITADGGVDGVFFKGGSFSPRNAYPLLLPFNAATVMRLTGQPDDRQVRWLYVLLALAMALELRSRLATLASPSAGAWAAAIFLWSPQVLVEVEGGATSAYGDIAVGMFAGAAFFEIVRRGSPLRTGLWLSFLTLTKSEGLPLSLLLLSIAGLVFRRRIIPALFPLGAALVTLFVWRGRVERSDELDFASLITTLPRHADRYLQSLGALGEQLFAFRDWGLLLAFALLSIVVLARRKEWDTLLLSLAVVVPMVGLYAAVFAVTDWPIVEMRQNLAPRVMTHLLGPILFLTARATVPRSTPLSRDEDKTHGQPGTGEPGSRTLKSSSSGAE
jgi:hypothetical protein